MVLNTSRHTIKSKAIIFGVIFVGGLKAYVIHYMIILSSRINTT